MNKTEGRSVRICWLDVGSYFLYCHLISDFHFLGGSVWILRYPEGRALNISSFDIIWPRCLRKWLVYSLFTPLFLESGRFCRLSLDSYTSKVGNLIDMFLTFALQNGFPFPVGFLFIPLILESGLSCRFYLDSTVGTKICTRIELG